MPARVSKIRTALLALIEAEWVHTAPDEVIEDYLYDIYAADLTGRKVLVVLDAYSGFPATRGEDTTDYGYQVWIAERYTGAGYPPNSWIEERLEFVEELVALLGNVRRVPFLTTEPEVFPLEADVTTAYDIVELSETKLFISVITLLLREDADG